MTHLNQDTRNIMIVRALRGLGDLLCTTPAWRALRASFPAAHITLLGLPAAQPLTARYAHLLDAHLSFPGFPGIPEAPANVTALPAFLQSVQGRYDVAIQMHGSGLTSNAFTQLLAADTTAGFYQPPAPCPDARTFHPYPDHLPEPRRWLHLLQQLGCTPQGEHLEFPITSDDEAQAHLLPEMRNLQRGQYAVLHPGASEPHKRWSPRYFARAADDLAERGLQVVLTGSADEADVTTAVREHMRAPSIDLTARTTLGVLAVLLRDARLLLCNDTGISHLAAAIRTPSVVVFSASDPARWAPLDRQRHRAVGQGQSDVPGARPQPPTVEEVLGAVHDQLQPEVMHAQ